MVGYRPFKGETPADFNKRVNPLLKKLRLQHFRASWEEEDYRTIYVWAGHVSRISTYDPSRLTPQILHFENYKSIINRYRGPSEGQGHGRRVNVWRWESNCCKALGPDWEQYTTNRDEWNHIVSDLVRWRASEAWHLPYSRAFLTL